jgi:hypothetical protein
VTWLAGCASAATANVCPVSSETDAPLAGAGIVHLARQPCRVVGLWCAGILFATASNLHLCGLADGELPGSQPGAFR